MACASFSSRLYECASCCHAKISYCVCQPTAEFKELTRSMTMYSKNWWTVTVTQWGFSLASGGHGSPWPQWSSDVFNHSVQAGASKDSKLFWPRAASFHAVFWAAAYVCPTINRSTTSSLTALAQAQAIRIHPASLHVKASVPGVCLRAYLVREIFWVWIL